MRKLIVAVLLIVSSTGLFSQITEIGLASFYADKFDGRITASGDIFDQSKLTAAHRTLPFGSKVKVTNLENGKDIIVIVNDRGPFVNDRVIDLSKSGAKKLGFVDKGVTKVKLEVLSIPENKGGKIKTAYVPPKQDKTKSPKSKAKASTNLGTISNQAIEYYKVESEQITPQGFGIQVASYQEAANLIKRCDEIRKNTGKDVIIQVGNNSGDKVYRIILGPFSTRNQASEYSQKLQSQYRGCFVVGF